MENFSVEKPNFCAVIAEYNPFHKGHLYHLSQAKALSSCDGLLVVMSGNFLQRGDCAVTDKYTRAKHAVLGGADLVAELPLPFSVGNAETFACGAVKLLSSLPFVTHLAFGTECGKAEDFLSLAAFLLKEPPAFKKALKEELKKGVSFATAKANAISMLLPSVDKRLYTSPNCILGLEYAKAVLRFKSKLILVPVPRIGNEYKDTDLKETYSSASAVRTALLSGNDPTSALPDFVTADMPLMLKKEDYSKFDTMKYFALFCASNSFLRKLPDCSEGLECYLKRTLKESFTIEELIEKATCKRYTSARLNRIVTCATLGITKKDVKKGLRHGLYCNLLAIKKERADELLPLLKKSLPLLVRKGDEKALSKTGKKIFDLTLRADELYATFIKRQSNPHLTLFV